MSVEDIPTKIEDLIVATSDPSMKALLLILSRVSDNLVQNTRLTEALTDDLKKHRDEFAAHEKVEMALINQGRGFLRAMVIALTMAQAISVWAFNRHLASEEDTANRVGVVERFVGEHKVHHEMEERQKAK